RHCAGVRLTARPLWRVPTQYVGMAPLWMREITSSPGQDYPLLRPPVGCGRSSVVAVVWWRYPRGRRASATEGDSSLEGFSHDVGFDGLPVPDLRLLRDLDRLGNGHRRGAAAGPVEAEHRAG